MAFEMQFGYEKARDLLMLSIINDARPIMLVEASEDSRKLLYDEVFSQAGGIILIPFEDFLMEYIYSIKKQESLLSYSYVIVDDIENLRGRSGTLKILSTFIDNMISNNVSVIFLGSELIYDMQEVIRIAGSKMQYIIRVNGE